MKVQTMARPAEKMAALPADRVDALDWSHIADELSSHGAAILPHLLTPEQCRGIASLYPDDSRFRSHVVMARHGYGKGEYKHFAYPLPDLIGGLRTALYPRLAPIANGWNERMGIDVRYPPNTRSSSTSATRPARSGRRRYSCNMTRATTTACTRTFTAISPFPCRWRSCCRSPAGTTPGASSS